MKTRYRLIRRGIRGGKFYCVDTTTGKRTSLRTESEEDAQQIINAKNQAEHQPALNPCHYPHLERPLLRATDAKR